MARKVKLAGMEIDWPTQVSEVQEALTGLGHRVVGFAYEPAARGGIRFYLAGGEPVVSGGAQYSALPLLDEFSLRFWFALDMSFGVERGRAVFEQIGILVLGGTLAGDAREMFRAEWEPAATPHAQPHWHVVGTEIAHTFTIAARDSFDELDENKQRTLDISRFHFAMSARWMDGDTEPGRHQISPVPGGVKRWVRACLEYSTNQLRYLGRRAFRPADDALG